MQKDYLPSADFFDFEVYQLPASKESETLSKTEKPVVVFLKNAPAEDLALLSKIFQAVGKNMEQDAYLVNGSDLPLYNNITANPHVQKVLFFGVNPLEVGLQLQAKAYELLPFQGKQLLFSHNLGVIAQDLEKKKQLWGRLQAMFQK